MFSRIYQQPLDHLPMLAEGVCENLWDTCIRKQMEDIIIWWALSTLYVRTETGPLSDAFQYHFYCMESSNCFSCSALRSLMCVVDSVQHRKGSALFLDARFSVAATLAKTGCDKQLLVPIHWAPRSNCLAMTSWRGL